VLLAIGLQEHTEQALEATARLDFASHGISLNQVEMHPLLDNRELLDLCNRAGIVLEGYSPLGEGHSDLMAHPTVLRIAGQVGKEPAWVLLSWAAQRDRPVVVKSSHADRMKDNFRAMQCCDEDCSTDNLVAGEVDAGGDCEVEHKVLLSDEQLAELSELCIADMKFCWDPRRVA
jgi:glycerol 2-dehydrogenase (NADP+)